MHSLKTVLDVAQVDDQGHHRVRVDLCEVLGERGDLVRADGMSPMTAKVFLRPWS
ncbi:MAG TPA: hypothetical protein VGC37_00935 [Friedmanniella sp.]